MKVFGIVNDWTTLDKGVRDIVIEVISRHYYMISQQISKWAKKKQPKAAQGWYYDGKILLQDIYLTHEHESFGLASYSLPM